MIIKYASDLHLEFDQVFPAFEASQGEDVVVLSGDIDSHHFGVRWAKLVFKDRPVVYVLGNHEMYHGHWDEVLERCRKEAAGSNVHVLERDSVVIDGVRFIGCTLWTDFNGWKTGTAEQAMRYAQGRMNDFRLIEGGIPKSGDILTPEETVERHRQSVEWLDREISKSDLPVVVVTHHGPSMKGCAERHRGDLLAPAFLNDLEHLIRAPVRAWIYGHTHHSTEFTVAGIPVVSNQGGYPQERGRNFKPEAIIEVRPA
mgnify:CR=1 FL=1